jgi:ERF superfamily
MEASMRSNDSIAQLACALAKAQIELVNPPKSLTACLNGNGNGSSDQVYRYAPLSAGLDIIRKTLGKHEIAVLQTTDLDRDSGLVMLTTTLAHGSGEWIAARWPVCRIDDLPEPKLMGAALTYARRYGLFTLVGLAGEDDLDAPELAPETLKNRPRPADTASAENGPQSRTSRPRGRARKVAPPDRSSGAEDLAAELARVEDADRLLRWALYALPRRNRMSDEERGALDRAFSGTRRGTWP